MYPMQYNYDNNCVPLSMIIAKNKIKETIRMVQLKKTELHQILYLQILGVWPMAPSPANASFWSSENLFYIQE